MALFGRDTMKLIVLETNRMHLAQSGRTPPILELEMRQFLGICLYMSVFHLPDKRMYWARDHRIAVIADTMKRDRFLEILRLLHFSNNELQPASGSPGSDRLYKIRAVLDLISSHFTEFVDFEPHLSVDEQMVPFKGNHSLKNYIKNKPIKWGYKVLALAGQSGYVYRFQIAGDNLLEHNTAIEPEIGKSGLVVLELAEGLPPGSQLYFDNWFSSPLLIKRFGEMNIAATGTIRQNRKAGCLLKSEKELRQEGRGAYDFKSSDGVVVCDWYDNRLVSIASNFHSVEPTTIQQRWCKKQKKYVSIPCPNIISAYNRSMGGVDRCDMMVSLYRMKMKGKKWYKRLFFHFVDLALLNAWTMLRQTTQPKLKLVDYKIDVAVALIRGGLGGLQLHRIAGPAPGRDSRQGPAAEADDQPVGSSGDQPDPPSVSTVNSYVRYDGSGHLPRKVAKLPKYCKMEGCKRRSKMHCVKCMVYLCIDEKSDCFYRFHCKS